MNRWQEFQDKLATETTPLQGEISLYCSVTALYTILPEILGTFRQAYPGVHLKLQTGAAEKAINKVIQDDADLTVTALPEKLPPQLDFIFMTETPLVFIAPVAETAFCGKLREPVIP